MVFICIQHGNLHKNQVNSIKKKKLVEQINEFNKNAEYQYSKIHYISIY